MISFSEVKRYINDSPAIMRFKPWWEISLDLLLAGLFLVMLLSWTRSFSIESGGIICVPIDGDMSSYGTADARYVQSRCYMESSIRTIEFYPYVLFIQWLVMFLCQITWIWIPVVVAKFKYFYSIFTEMLNVEPEFVYNPNNLGILPDIDYTDDNREKLKVIHDKLTFMLMDKNYISRVYRRKVYALTFIIACCIFIMIFWILFVRFLEANFSCTLDSGKSKKASAPNVCNIAPQLYVYGIMILHVTILVIMLTLSAKGLLWHRWIQRELPKGSERLFGEHGDNYKGLPGYEDLFLILELMRRNVRDGNFMLSILTYVLAAKYNLQRPCGLGDASFGDKKQRVSYSFWEEYCVTNIVLNELGLEFESFIQHPSKLFDILEQIRADSPNLDLNFKDSIVDKVLSEIYQNIIYLKSVAESKKCRPLESRSSTGVTKKKYSFSKKLDGILKSKEYPDHVILLAAANALLVRFILISVHVPAEDDIFSYDVIKPFNRMFTKTVFLVFISPHYYYSVRNKADITNAQLVLQSQYSTNRNFRDKSRLKATRKVLVARSNENETCGRKKVKFADRENKTFLDRHPEEMLVSSPTNTSFYCNTQRSQPTYRITSSSDERTQPNTDMADKQEEGTTFFSHEKEK